MQVMSTEKTETGGTNAVSTSGAMENGAKWVEGEII